MIWRHNRWKRLVLAALAVLWLPAAASAQNAQGDTQLSEDLRVMSALVDETVSDFYKKLGTANCMSCHTGNLGTGWRGALAEGQFAHGALADWHFGATPEKSNATFVEGVGVVVQLTAPAFPEAGAIDIEANIVKGTPSRWEQMRQKLEGGGAQSVLATGMTVDLKAVHLSRDDLIDKLASLLAESGHNFRNLGMGDKIAIALTFEKSNQWQTWTGATIANAHSGLSGEGQAAGEGGVQSGVGAGGNVPVLGDVPLIGNLMGQTKRAAPLPTRITVIANKTDIDAVHAGTMSPEQFREAVSVRVIEPAIKDD